MSGIIDIALVQQAKSGDKHAFGVLIERCLPMVKRVARRMVLYPDIADELAQEAVLEAFLSLDSLRDDSRFVSWLYGITLNVCRSYLRAQKIDWLSFDDAVGGRWLDVNPFVSVEPSPEQVIETQELHARVLQAVNALPQSNREAVLLFYYDDLTLRETAAILNISVSALKVRLHRARSRLQTSLMPVVSSKERVRHMIPVTFANMIQVERDAIEEIPGAKWNILLLLDRSGRRVLPIWIGLREGDVLIGSLKFAANDGTIKRPMQLNFLLRILEASDMSLEQVTVSALKGDVFYATARFKQGQTTHEIDARPSDAVSLALMLDVPLFVSNEVMTRAAWAVPDDFDIDGSLLGRGVAGLQDEIAPALLEFDETKTREQLEAMEETARNEYLTEQHSEALKRIVFSG